MAITAFENQWIFAASTIAIWVAIFVVLETVVFDGELLSGVIRGTAGGFAFALVYSLFRRNRDR